MTDTEKMEHVWRELLSLTQAAETQVMLDVTYNKRYDKESRQQNLNSIKQKIAEIEALHRA